VEKEKLSYTIGVATMENIIEDSQKKLKTDLPYDLVVLLFDITKGNTVRVPKKYLHIHVYCSMIHNYFGISFRYSFTNNWLKVCGTYTRLNIIQP
jgi:hypothetical protein